jgi:hypothetical protein
MLKPKLPSYLSEPRAMTIKPVATERVLVLFGYDEDKKPRAAKFWQQDFEPARKAAEMMGLQVHEGETKKLRPHLSKIALGEVYKSGWGGIPKIQQKQYDALVKKLTGKAAAKPGAPPVTGYPVDWNKIEVGHLVIAPTDKPDQDGYFAAIVTKVDGNMLSLTLKDFPDETGKRHRSTVALLDPNTHG